MVKPKKDLTDYFKFLEINWRVIVAKNGKDSINGSEAQELIWQTFVLNKCKVVTKAKKKKSSTRPVWSFDLRNPFLDKMNI